jgi:serine/threonine-protein kinase SRPK3
MARDCKNEMLVSIKIHKSSPCFLESAFDECEMLQMINKKMDSPEWNEELVKLLGREAYKNEGFCVRLLNSFVIFGPFGNHFCMVFEYLGPSLAQILSEAQEKNIEVRVNL